MTLILDFPVDYSNLRASVYLQLFKMVHFESRKRSEEEKVRLRRLKCRAVEQIQKACAGRPNDLLYYQGHIHHMDWTIWP